MKRLNKENVFLLLTVIASTLAFVIQSASVDTVMTIDRKILLQLAILFTIIFGLLFVSFRNSDKKNT